MTDYSEYACDGCGAKGDAPCAKGCTGEPPPEMEDRTYAIQYAHACGYAD